MKYVLSLTILGFIVLSCQKKTEVSNASTSDTAAVIDNLTTSQVPLDTATAVDSSALPTRTVDTVTTTK
ncbi:MULTISPECIES: hypothetical protein [Chryseobacterium]|jgi:hypothetical protein|uniref:Uncharacterized protein n=1 Tax=Chryseobacterium geocarposphaerae TaxID=1416776 RepID=A0ABU1LFM0_9FLAO|nr:MULTISPECIES: hypothetical protein [Chryseobacterium]MDR6405513.1 hypothetical protein [Chryseobacterium geocarposphaerae]MDR6698744.1 hypothetical protein [Chryseobacterium ginsenosidimutans]